MPRNALAHATVEDFRCALRWVASCTKGFIFDISKMVLAGGSAGGHGASMMRMLPPNSIFDRQCPTTENVRWNSGTELQLNVASFNAYDVHEPRPFGLIKPIPYDETITLTNFVDSTELVNWKNFLRPVSVDNQLAKSAASHFIVNEKGNGRIPLQ
jgi:hypothetical protein